MKLRNTILLLFLQLISFSQVEIEKILALSPVATPKYGKTTELNSVLVKMPFGSAKAETSIPSGFF